MPALSKAWKWIAENRRWPYKNRDHDLYGWYTVPTEEWGKYKLKRESSIPNTLIGGANTRQSGQRRRTRKGVVYMRNNYVDTISQAMSNLANGLALAMSAGVIK